MNWPESIEIVAAKMLAENCATTTQRNMRYVLRRFSAWAIVQYIQPADLSVHVFDNYIIHLQTKPRPLNSGGMLTEQIYIKGFCRRLFGENHPARQWKQIRYRAPLPQFLEIDDARRLAAAPLSDPLCEYPQRDHAIVCFFLWLAIRPCELRALNVGDVNMETDEVLIFGKGSKERKLFLCQSAKAALIGYLKYRIEPEADNEILFTTREGRRMTNDAIHARIARAGVFCGIHANPRKLRHTWATHAVDKDVNTRVIQSVLGHADISTAEIYAHVRDKKRKQVMKDLDDLNLKGANTWN